eukprot:scaffold6741_cov69-Skeletonema_dohrnii-CCMP3373.AAC.2
MQHASEKVAYAERMLPFARALAHHMHRYPGEGDGKERCQYAINQIEKKLRDDDEWSCLEEFKLSSWFMQGDGFCAGGLAVARLMLALAGPNADTPMTQQRMKRMMRTFPSWPSPSSDADIDLVRGREDAVIKRNFSVDFIHAATLCPSELPPLSGGTEQVQSAESVQPTKPFHRTNEQQRGHLANADKHVLVCVASFLEPCDMLHLALTCRRVGDKEYNVAAARQGRITGSWSLMEEVARCLVEANQREGDKEILRLARFEGESWLGAYQELFLFQSLQKNGVDVLKQKLEYIEHLSRKMMGGYFSDVVLAVRGPLALPQSYQSEDPIRSLKKRLPARASFTSICDHNHGDWHCDFHRGCLAMFRSLFGELSHIREPNENPGDPEDEEFEFEYQPSVEDLSVIAGIVLSL